MVTSRKDIDGDLDAAIWKIYEALVVYNQNNLLRQTVPGSRCGETLYNLTLLTIRH